MNWKKVFVSYSGKDSDLIDKFDLSLKAIGIEPFLAERAVATGQNVLVKIAENIRDSNAFVPFLTRNGLQNQWVNQEIGYAYRWMEQQAIDSPYFFPVVEEGLGQSIKGFLGIPVVEFAQLRIDEPKNAVYKLLLSLRKYINRNFVVLDQLFITCPSCGQGFSRNIPPQKAIDEAIHKKKQLETVCRVCKTTMTVDPHTLLGGGHIGGQRW